jgi:hypothetical protein
MKTTFPEEEIIQIVKKLCPNADNISNMAEGLVSQTYCFDNKNKKMVIQIGKELNVYKKEKYIHMNFHKNIHVRKVLRTGKIENGAYFCITEFINARKLQDLTHRELMPYLDHIMEQNKIGYNIEWIKKRLEEIANNFLK